jgi:hypothetical protein
VRAAAADVAELPGFSDSGVQLQLAALLMMAVFCAASGAWMFSRYRVFTRGLRGTALVVDVRPTSLVQRDAVFERATETVVLATAHVPRGVAAPQKVPAGQYAVGQVVPVVQHPRDAYRVYLDRPDLEHPVSRAYVAFTFSVVSLVLLAQTVLARL